MQWNLTTQHLVNIWKDSEYLNSKDSTNTVQQQGDISDFSMTATLIDCIHG